MALPHLALCTPHNDLFHTPVLDIRAIRVERWCNHHQQRGREGQGDGLSLLLAMASGVVWHAVETYPRSVSITWLAGCNPEGGGLVSSTAGSVSPLVCTISVGPFVVTFSITGILSSRAGLKEADIVTLCHLPGSQSKYSRNSGDNIHRATCLFLLAPMQGNSKTAWQLEWSEAIPGIRCQCKYISRHLKAKHVLLLPVFP